MRQPELEIVYTLSSRGGAVVKGQDTVSLASLLTDCLGELFPDLGIPGLTASLVHGDETATAAFGVRSLEDPQPVTPSTLFRIGSMTKALTATAAKAEAAQIMATAQSVKISGLEHELAEHREHVAKQYVSREAMNDVIQAINRLADRLDSLFMHFMPRPGQGG